MSITITVDRSSAPVEVREDMFGVNLVGGINEQDGLPNDGFIDAVDMLGGTRLRYPAGRAESENITELDVTKSGTDQLREDLRTYLDWVKETDSRTTLVLPALNDTHSDVRNVQEWAELLLTYMGDQVNLIVGYEIGNEFWAKINETEYGEHAYDIAGALSSVTVNGHQPEIWVQTASAVGGASDYKASDRGTISDSDAIAAMNLWDVNARPDDWLDGQSATEYFQNLGGFHRRVLKAELQLLEAMDADNNIRNGFQTDSATSGIDGIIAHYYFDEVIDGFDLTDTSSRTEIKAYDIRFALWEGLVPQDLSIQMTEWNVETQVWDWTGLRGASAFIEQFHSMIELGVDGADVWTVRHNTSSALAGSHNDERVVDLTPSGLAFELMRDSLTGQGDAMYALSMGGFDATQYEVNGFSNGYRSVIYVSSHSSSFDQSITLDLSAVGSLATSWSGKIIGIDAASSDGLSDNAAYDENGNLVSRLARRAIDDAERQQLIDLLGDAYESSHINSSNGTWITYLPQPEYIYLRPGVVTPTTLDDFYFATESDAVGSLRDVTQAQLGSDLSSLTFELDPHEIIEITIDHANMIFGDSTANTLFGGSGVDEINGSGGNDFLRGMDGRDVLIGGTGEDTVYGDQDNDRLEGKDGNDVLVGGAGNDKLVGGNGDDYIMDIDGQDDFVGGNGTDTASYYDMSIGVYVDLLTGSNNSSDTYNSIENIFGSNLANDTIWGDSGNNYVFGAGGADSLYGRDGDDTLNGGDGNDYLNDESGRNAFVGGAGQDTVSYWTHALGFTLNLTTGYNDNADTYSDIEKFVGSNIASDRFWGNGGANDFDGAGGDDTLHGYAGRDTLMGNDGVDRLYGGASNDYLSGGNGNDYLRDEDGIDTFDGGAGIDTAAYWGHKSGVTANLLTGANSSGDIYISIENLLGSDLANDTLIGDNGANELWGASYNDVLYGNGGDDTLHGGNDNDTMYGGTQNDRFYGGSGNDLMYGEADDDRFYGGSGNDTLIGGTGNDYLRDEDGSDVFDGGSGVDTASYWGHLTGVTVNLATGQNSSGDTYISIENLLGSDLANDTLIGDDGDNEIWGASYDDVLYGNGGNDTLHGGNDNDVMYGGAQDDRFYGGSGNDQMYGEDGEDRLYGGSGNDTLSGGIGNDYLRDDSGSDLFDGGAGTDTAAYWQHATGVSVNLLTGANSDGDTYVSIENLLGSDLANDTLVGDHGDNEIWGASYDDELYGNGGADLLHGGNGNDRLFGGDGVDRFYGGSGNDTMEGGNDADTFVFLDGFGQDVVSDFDHLEGDILDFRHVADVVSYADLLANHIAQSGTDVLITVGIDTITVQNVTLGDLSSGDFLF